MKRITMAAPDEVIEILSDDDDDVAMVSPPPSTVNPLAVLAPKQMKRGPLTAPEQCRCPLASCPIRGSFSDRGVLLEHVLATHRTSVFRCRLCPETKTFKGSDIRDHVVAKHSMSMEMIADVNDDEGDSDLEITNEVIPVKKEIPCTKCSKMFARVEDYHEHVSHEHKDMQFLCNSCGAIFRDLNLMREHRAQKHKDERRYRCDRCHVYTAADPSAIERHRRERCRLSVMCRCHLCGFTSADEEAYKRHFSSAKHRKEVNRRAAGRSGRSGQYAGRPFRRNTGKPDITVDKLTGQIYVGGQPLIRPMARSAASRL